MSRIVSFDAGAFVLIDGSKAREGGTRARTRASERERERECGGDVGREGVRGSVGGRRRGEERWERKKGEGDGVCGGGERRLGGRKGGI